LIRISAFLSFFPPFTVSLFRWQSDIGVPARPAPFSSAYSSFLPVADTLDLPRFPSWQLSKIIWIFYVSKIVEFADTWIMVLKKNNHQISFLHMYHHATIFPIWWWICFSFPGGDSYFSCAQNSFIHVIMYSYYLVRSFGINVPAGIKFMVTKGQMTQFLLNLFQALYVMVFDTAYPKGPAYLLLVYMASLLLLFNNFRVKGEAAARQQASKQKSQ
jgi:hypothetical protein